MVPKPGLECKKVTLSKMWMFQAFPLISTGSDRSSDYPIVIIGAIFSFIIEKKYPKSTPRIKKR
jgi:hypothetical protein